LWDRTHPSFACDGNTPRKPKSSSTTAKAECAPALFDNYLRPARSPVHSAELEFFEQ
jgi:hypothetical protein